jgi:hypothetical protein
MTTPVLPTSTAPSRPTPLRRISGAVALGLLMAGGVYLLGNLASSDVAAMVMTTVFFGAVLGAILLVVRRQHAWLLPLGLAFAVVATGAAVILGRPLLVDQVVAEDVVTVDEAGVMETATGEFVPLAHPGQGTATIVVADDGSATLTLTGFATDNGPDLRVYLTRGTGPSGDADSFVDLGALKGNRGDQQYAIPADVDLASFDAVVIWCRAFGVGFTQAPLTAR